jgi:hypothetical protein
MTEINPYEPSRLTIEEALPPLSEAEVRSRLDKLATRLALGAAASLPVPFVVIDAVEELLPNWLKTVGIALFCLHFACLLIIWCATDAVLRQRRYWLCWIGVITALLPGYHTLFTVPFAWPIFKELRDPRVKAVFVRPKIKTSAKSPYVS